MSSEPQLMLRVISGDHAGAAFTVDDTCFLGSQEICEIRLQDEGIASMHARIGLRGNSFAITDLTRAADLKVNNTIVKSRRLAYGDIITIAGVLLEVVDPDEATDADAPMQTGSQKDDSDALKVVGLEESPATEVIIPKKTSFTSGPEYNVMLAGDEVPEGYSGPEPEGEHVEVPLQNKRRELSSATEPQAESAVSRHMRESAEGAKKERGVPGFIFVLVGIAVIAAGVFGVSLRSQGKLKKEILLECKRVEDFAEEHRGEHALVLMEYRKLKEQIPEKFSDIAANVAAAINGLELKIARQEQDYQSLLHSLDNTARALAAQNRYDEAVSTYELVRKDYRKRVLTERAEEIESLLTDKKTFLELREEKKRIMEAERTRIRGIEAEKVLTGLSEKVVTALIDGKNEVAEGLITEALKNELLVPYRAGIEEALKTVKVLAAQEKAGPATSPDEEMSEAEVPPVVSAIMFLKEDDQLAAKNILRTVDFHVLKPALYERIGLAADKMKMENRAMLAFVSAWKKLEGKPVRKIPRPDKCAEVLKEAADSGSVKDLPALLSELMACRKGYPDTDFVKRYSSLFDYAYTLYPSVAAEEDDSIAIGDGKVIQVDGRKCYVESSADFSAMDSVSVGFFDRTAVYFGSAGERKPVAVKIKVLAVLPAAKLGASQLAVTVPAVETMPKVGARVLIGSSLEKGVQIKLLQTAPSGGPVFEDGFDSKLGDDWTSSREQSAVIKDGRLQLRSSAAAGSGNNFEDSASCDASLKYDFSGDAVSLEFDLVRSSARGMAVAMGDIGFVIGGEKGAREGIYLRGRLVADGELLGKKYGDTDRVSITLSDSVAGLTVGDKELKAGLSSKDCGADLGRIRFYVSDKVFIDNVRIVSGASAAHTGVLGASADSGEVVLLRGSSSEWSTVAAGQNLHFSKASAEGTDTGSFVGRVIHEDGRALVCALPKGSSVGPAARVSVGKPASTTAGSDAKIADPIALRPIADRTVVTGSLRRKSESTLRFTLDMPVKLPSSSYAYSIASTLKHPQSGEVLSVLPAVGKQAPLRQLRNSVVIAASRAPLSKTGYANGIIFSSASFSEKRPVDVSGLSGASSAGGFASVSKSKGLWTVDRELWGPSGGRLISKSGRKGIPVLHSPVVFTKNAQFDLNVVMEAEGEEDAQDWVRDIMLELFHPATQRGLTFGVGLKNGGRIYVGGRTASLVAEDAESMTMLPLPGTAVEKDALEGSLGDLTAGREYALRVRRVGDEAVLYINGIRIVSVNCPWLGGDVQLKLAAPENTVSIGRTSMRDLPDKCSVPSQADSIGDFGYVLTVKDGKVIVDSDTYALKANSKVTIMGIESVVQGEKSRTTVLKKAASGVVSAIGPRTAVVRVTEKSGDLKPGMKVFAGEQEASLFLTDERLRDVEKGL